MDLIDYLKIIEEILKNIFTGLLALGIVIGLGYGLYFFITHITATIGIILLIFVIAYWIGRAIRND